MQVTSRVSVNLQKSKKKKHKPHNENQKQPKPKAGAKEGTKHADWTQRGKGCARAWPNQADSIFRRMVVYKFYFPMRDGFILEIILDQEKLEV